MLSKLDKAIIIRLQDELPLVPQPYAAMAEELGITETELLERITELHNKGVLRRLGALLHHRTAGYSANTMVVWAVPEEKTEEAGKIMASFAQVSHCYKRLSCPDWPYNMYTMVHAKTRQECEEIVFEIADAVRIYEYRMLYSTREVKKCSMKYFLEEEYLHIFFKA